MGGPWSYTDDVVVVVIVMESDDSHSGARISCTQLAVVAAGHSGLVLLVCSSEVQVGKDDAVSAVTTVEKLVGEQLELRRALSIGEQ